MSKLVRITAPSRLHFGLLRFAQTQGPSYGGLGMMIQEPRLVIEVRRSSQWRATGPLADRALAHARQVQQKWPPPSSEAIDVHVRESPPQHAGLGSGTQLALAVALGVRTLRDLAPATLASLVDGVGRGTRSAVGSYGFESGGLVWETGYSAGNQLGQLAARLPVPDSWRILLVSPHTRPGLHGKSELEAFGQLAPVPPEVTAQLYRIAEQQILPAAERGDFDLFTASLFQYGHLAGSCFTRIQNGPYASRQIASCIDRLRRLGCAGVGQSSWGPTIFAFCATERDAAELAEKLSQLAEFSNAAIQVSAPDNRGAQVQRVADSAT